MSSSLSSHSLHIVSRLESSQNLCGNLISWELGTRFLTVDISETMSSLPTSEPNAKRRQYPTGQAQAYYGPVDDVRDVASNPELLQTTVPALQHQLGGQFQITQPSYSRPAHEAEYINASPVNALAEQFGQVGIASRAQTQLFTTNLLASPPDPRDLHRPPPEIRLPPNACITSSPEANAHPSYQRSTLNAIPTTADLLSKSKIPLALVVTPYRSLEDDEDPVPVATDTVIARCRRCRMYMNPYVQFIDGGSR